MDPKALFYSNLHTGERFGSDVQQTLRYSTCVTGMAAPQLSAGSKNTFFFFPVKLGQSPQLG